MPAAYALLEGLAERIRNRTARLCVTGLGYVGLPLVRTFCQAGFSVCGLDVDIGKVNDLKSGRSYLKTVQSDVVAGFVSKGIFRPTADFASLQDQDAIVVCVPTPLTKHRQPDLSYVVNTTKAIAEQMRRGQLIVLESTSYPGTTREVVLPLLEATGLVVGSDFFLGFSPEREDPGRTTHTTRTTAKIVSGVDSNSADATAVLYSAVVDQVVRVSSCEVAEACKILENVYRAVNIALVNELKMLFDRMKIDIWEVIAGASTKPFGFQPFYPGPGLGGHCIPIDPFYLVWKAREFNMPTRFVELAGEINLAMPGYVIGKLADALNERCKPLKGAKVLVLGLAYKKDVDDLRESPSVEIIEQLRAKGANVDYNDPYIARAPKQRNHELNMVSRPIDPVMLAEYDAVLIATDHSAYDYQAIVDDARLVIDTRNATAFVTAPFGRIVRA